MQQKFDPKKDFLAPIGMFTQSLLGDGIHPDTADKVAGIQSLLVVMARHMPVPDNLGPGELKKYKDDRLFKHIDKDYADLEQEVIAMLPGDADPETEIASARALVDTLQGVPDVPSYGAILAKHLPKEIVDTCLQVQAGLRIMAINNAWPGNEKIVKARIFDNDPKGLNDAQLILNHLHDSYLSKVIDDEPIPPNIYRTLAYSRTAGYMAIIDGKEKLETLQQDNAVSQLDDYLKTEEDTVEIYPYKVAAEKYFAIIAKSNAANTPPKPSP